MSEKKERKCSQCGAIIKSPGDFHCGNCGKVFQGSLFGTIFVFFMMVVACSLALFGSSNPPTFFALVTIVFLLAAFYGLLIDTPRNLIKASAIREKYQKKQMQQQTSESVEK